MKTWDPKYNPSYKQLNDYSGLLPSASGRTESSKRGYLPETLATVNAVIIGYRSQVKKLAAHLKAETAEQSAFNVWHWCIMNIRYKMDRYGMEEIRTPARSWMDRMGGIDCDDFTILCCSLLLEMGYRPVPVIVAMHGSKDYQHIYCCIDPQLDSNGIITGGIVIDPVWKRFNEHPEGITKSKIMEIQILGTTGKKSKKVLICGFGAIAEADNYTRRLQIYQSSLINRIKTGQDTEHHRRELRKVRYMIKLNGSPERDVMAAVISHIYDIDKKGNFVFEGKDKATAVREYLEAVSPEDFSYGMGPEFSTLGASFSLFTLTGLSGRDWDRKDAEKAQKQIAGKVDNIRRAVRYIIGTDPAKVEKNHQNDFKAVLDGARQVGPSTEERYKLFLQYSQDWGNSTNLKEGAFQFSKIEEMEKGILKSEDKVKRWTTKDLFEKVTEGIVRYNPLTIAARNGWLLATKLNFRNQARAMYIGLMTDAELAESGYDATDRDKMKRAVDKQIEIFEKIGGKGKNFLNAIRDGKDKNPLLGKGALKGLGEPVSATAAVAAATGLLVAAGKIIKETGIKFKKKDADPEGDIPIETVPLDFGSEGFTSEDEQKDAKEGGGGNGILFIILGLTVATAAVAAFTGKKKN